MVLGLSFLIFVVSGLGYWIPYILKNQYDLGPQVSGVIAGLVMLIGGVCGALVGSIYQDYKLRPFQRRFEAGELDDDQISDIRSIISLKVCRLSIFVSSILLTSGAFSGYLPVFLTCYAAGSFINFLNIGSFGVALMSCVDKTHRNHAVAVALFISQLLGGFPSTFVVGGMIQYLDTYWAVVILMLFLAPCFVLWHFAYVAAKQGSLAYVALTLA
jgi:hypothetical protein